MPLLPGELAQESGVPLAELETALQRLTAAGFDIEWHPSRGCRLLASPDRMMADDLQARVGGECALAREILVFEETSSTNDVASRLAREGHRGGAVVIAERQTAGRGRFGRRWESADHAGLWFSLLLRPPWPMARWPRLTIWAGVCVAAVVEQFAGMPARIKWPNDVLLNGQKVAGILIESAVDAQGAPFAIAGIGLNVNQADFPPELEGKAGSIRQVTGRMIDRPALMAALLRELDARYAGAATDEGLITEASRRSALLGTWIRLQSGAVTMEGVAEGMDENGNLLLRLGDGTMYTASAGEVTSRVG